MAYVGTPIDVGNQFSSLVGKRFSGDASTTAFTLDVRANSALDIEVFVENVRQDPNSAYTVDGTTLTFTAAPPSGTNNIYVVHQAPTVASVSPTAGSVTASSFDNSVISGHTALAATPADTDEFLISDAGTIKRIDFSHIKGQGKIAQVVQTTKTDTFSSSSTSLTDITGFSVAITPSATSSKVLVVVNVGMLANNQANGTMIALLRDSTNLISSSAGGSADTLNAWNSGGGGGMDDNGRKFHSPNISFLDSPSSSSSLTYKCQMVVNGGTGYFNRWEVNNDMAAVSTITVMEILA